MAKNWIAGAVSGGKGGLHKALGVAAGTKIPMGKIEKAADRSGKVGKEARLAETLEGLNKTGRHGGVIGKVAAGKMGHAKQGTERVESDRGSFGIKG